MDGSVGNARYCSYGYEHGSPLHRSAALLHLLRRFGAGLEALPFLLGVGSRDVGIFEHLFELLFVISLHVEEHTDSIFFLHAVMLLYG